MTKPRSLHAGPETDTRSGKDLEPRATRGTTPADRPRNGASFASTALLCHGGGL